MAESAEFEPSAFDLDSRAPLRIGAGSHDRLNGRLKDVRLYRGALGAEAIEALSAAR